MTTTLTTLPAFATMDDYKTWRAAWRVEYAQLTLDIRAAKQTLRTAQRAFSVAFPTSSTTEERTAIRTCKNTMWSAESALVRLRVTAREAIDARHQSKVNAAELYAATHAEAA